MSLEQHTQSLFSTLEKANLLPGSAASLIPAGFKPTTKLDILFGDRALELGTLFRASECKVHPTIRFNQEVSPPFVACVFGNDIHEGGRNADSRDLGWCS